MTAAVRRTKTSMRRRLPVDILPPPRRSDQAFLPADLEILETPPSPVRMALILLICSFVTIAVAWSWIGKIEIIAEARGKIQPTGRVKVIQPLEVGKVAEIHVENGQIVHKGEVLIRMDQGDAEAELAEAASALASYRAEVQRRQIAIEAAKMGHVPPTLTIPWSNDVPVENRQREELVLKSDLAQLTSEVGSFDAQIKQKEIERDRLAETMAAQADLLATLSERVDMRTALFATKAASRASILDSLETQQTQRTVLSTQKSQHDTAVANLEVLAREREKVITTFLADNGQKLATAEREVDDLQQKLTKAQLRLEHTSLISPIDGTVLGLSVTTIGQVLSAGEEVMRIVPGDATLEIESYLANKDIGFVKIGQTAIVKIDSFPFTRYGTVSAQVIRVANDAIPQPEAQQTETNGTQGQKSAPFTSAERTQNLVFPVTLSLNPADTSSIGQRLPLSAGMSVSVEIKTDSRRILDFFISPLVEVGSRSFRER